MVGIDDYTNGNTMRNIGLIQKLKSLIACNFYCNIWCHAAVFCRNYRKIYFLLLHVNQGKRNDQLKTVSLKTCSQDVSC